eukprot:scaffold130053_cov54-Phaeocystis_antarctica.AAC.3
MGRLLIDCSARRAFVPAIEESDLGGAGGPAADSRSRRSVDGASCRLPRLPPEAVDGGVEYVHNSRHVPVAAVAAPARLCWDVVVGGKPTGGAFANSPELDRRGFGRLAEACGVGVISRTALSGGLGDADRPADAINGGVTGDIAPARGNKPRDTAVPSPIACELGDPRLVP